MRLSGLNKENAAHDEKTSVDAALTQAGLDLEAREKAVKDAKNRAKQARKDAQKEQRNLHKTKQENKAAQRFAELAANPSKAYAKVRRDTWTRRALFTAATTAALSLTAQFTDYDKRATQSIKDSYNAIMETIHKMTDANDVSIQKPSSQRPQARPENFKEIVLHAQNKAAIDRVLTELNPAGPDGS